MRYVIIGAGAIGAGLAAEFELAGVDYLLIARGAQLARLAAEGLRYALPEGERRLRLRVADAAGALPLRQDDVLFLTVKTQDVAAAVAAWAGAPVAGGGIAADLPLVTFQNGLAAEGIAARRFSRIYAASILVPAVHTEAGRVSVHATGGFALVYLGRFPEGRDAVSARITADLTRARSIAEERGDIRRWKAAKLLHNVKNVLELFAGDAEAREAAGGQLVSEARAALLAAGHDLARPEERRVDVSGWRVLPVARERGGQSTWQSFIRGASSEVDFLNGEIARLGLIHGVPAPWNRAAVRLAAELAEAGLPPGAIDLDRLRGAAEGLGASPRPAIPAEV